MSSDRSGFTATRYTRDDDPPLLFGSVNVELRCKAGEGPHAPPHDWWAVTFMGRTLNRDGEWEFEPQPSSREDDYLARNRFTLDEALTLARRADHHAA